MGILLTEQKKRAKIARRLVKNSNLAMHIGSVAIALEALEEILVEKGLLEPDQLMERIKVLTQNHYERGEFIPPEAD